jgi:hypothetical protein
MPVPRVHYFLIEVVSLLSRGGPGMVLRVFFDPSRAPRGAIRARGRVITHFSGHYVIIDLL